MCNDTCNYRGLGNSIFGLTFATFAGRLVVVCIHLPEQK